VGISFFVPCFIDQLTPQVGLATAKVLKRLGHHLVYHGTEPKRG